MGMTSSTTTPSTRKSAAEEDYDTFVQELQRHDMGQILDMVPNHMGITGSLNPWWTDVLENGPSSLYASYFDIDWMPVKTNWRTKCCCRS